MISSIPLKAFLWIASIVVLALCFDVRALFLVAEVAFGGGGPTLQILPGGAFSRVQILVDARSRDGWVVFSCFCVRPMVVVVDRVRAVESSSVLSI